MSRIAGSAAEVTYRDYRRRYVPVVSTIIACLAAALPIVLQEPLIPDLGFMVLLSWRLLRPEIWRPTTALWLGLVNDLLAGNPLGQSMALWTTIFLALDVVESRLGLKDFILDWLFAAAAILFHGVAVWYIALLMGSDISLMVMVPQIALSVLAYPLIARLVLGLDRWRLAR